MLFKVIFHKRKPCKASETFDRGNWAAVFDFRDKQCGQQCNGVM